MIPSVFWFFPKQLHSIACRTTDKFCYMLSSLTICVFFIAMIYPIVRRAVISTQLNGSVNATPKYPNTGTINATDAIFTQSSRMEEKRGAALCPIPCSEHLSTNNGPSAGKNQAPTLQYMAALSMIRLFFVLATHITRGRANNIEKQIKKKDIAVTIPSAVLTPLLILSILPAP